jgi:hypothetical protein
VEKEGDGASGRQGKVKEGVGGSITEGFMECDFFTWSEQGRMIDLEREITLSK